MHAPATLSYFCALPSRSFWAWESFDDGSTASIHWPSDRQLIAFRPELEKALEAFLLHGFPPLGSLLLVLDALRAKWTTSECFERLAAAMGSISGEKELSPRSRELIENVSRGLDHLHRLPAALTTPGPAHERLLRTLFEGCGGLLDAAESRVILAQFVQTPQVTVFAQRSPGLNGVARFLKDLHVLAKAFEHCPPEGLEARLRTGLEETPTAAIELPIPKPEGPADLIKALETEGGELAQVAGLARRLNAILHVPRAVVQPQGLPVGGVTDIANRGDPSQLLVTELAWDDLTFAARLSQGEALYLRREAPPAEPPPQRILLIDTGIFLWGKPRLFALGAALALLGQRHAASCQVYALEADGFKATALDSVALVRAHLGRLQPSPHAGPALANLTDADESPFDTDREIIFISHPAAQESVNHLPAWRRLCETSAIHTLLVDLHGDIEFARHNASGIRVLSRVHVDADDLFEPPKQSRAPLKQMRLALTDPGGLLPRFYEDNNWPLLHPAPPDPSNIFKLKNGALIGLSISGCLCLWPSSPDLGKILLPRTPTSSVYSAAVSGEDGDKVVISFLGNRPSSSLVVVTVSLKGREIFSFNTVDIGDSTLTGGLSDYAFPCWQSGCLIIHLDSRSDAYPVNHRGDRIASVPRSSERGWPVFDGKQFHKSSKGSANWEPLERASSLPTRHSQRQFIRRIHSVAFGTTGVLMIMTEGGHTYRLNTHNSGLSWEGRRLPGDIFHNLHPVSHPKWEELELAMCQFPDGRRVVYDPRGYLHVCTADDDSEKISIILVKGHTAAWSSRERYYGEPNLLKGRHATPMTEIIPVLHKLFRASEAPAR
jgi:hypothetical protein